MYLTTIYLISPVRSRMSVWLSTTKSQHTLDPLEPSAMSHHKSIQRKRRLRCCCHKAQRDLKTLCCFLLLSSRHLLPNTNTGSKFHTCWLQKKRHNSQLSITKDLTNPLRGCCHPWHCKQTKVLLDTHNYMKNRSMELGQDICLASPLLITTLQEVLMYMKPLLLENHSDPEGTVGFSTHKQLTIGEGVKSVARQSMVFNNSLAPWHNSTPCSLLSPSESPPCTHARTHAQTHTSYGKME